jgi:hypothetical protein
MTTLVFFLEELSAQVMLEAYLPKILPGGYQIQFVVFDGKSDLEKRLMQKLKGWNKPDCRFIVLRDQDSADCKKVKETLRQKCIEGNHPEALIRIACRELESWYLGDLSAVEQGLGIQGLKKRQRKEKYRDPDKLGTPSRELFLLTKENYQKVSGSRKIGVYLDPESNNSHSFRVFSEGISRIIRDAV